MISHIMNALGWQGIYKIIRWVEKGERRTKFALFFETDHHSGRHRIEVFSEEISWIRAPEFFVVILDRDSNKAIRLGSIFLKR